VIDLRVGTGGAGSIDASLQSFDRVGAGLWRGLALHVQCVDVDVPAPEIGGDLLAGKHEKAAGGAQQRDIRHAVLVRNEEKLIAVIAIPTRDRFGRILAIALVRVGVRIPAEPGGVKRQAGE
jgi:hypothetical protein